MACSDVWRKALPETGEAPQKQNARRPYGPGRIPSA
jgi:hypothetical protein